MLGSNFNGAGSSGEVGFLFSIVRLNPMTSHADGAVLSEFYERTFGVDCKIIRTDMLIQC